MNNGPFVEMVRFPINHSDFPQLCNSHYQRVKLNHFPAMTWGSVFENEKDSLVEFYNL